ncbi:hypothetical protein [Ferroplasma sp.]|uniref:hypothetical protein n=1 Tax=Ferroplasma sp. TaxID=2591003 RepID=UPI0026213C31|nr:hypothetical protein [Ferroplasma sp.]MCL4453803.1 hypothetical protein [Candidatus Thermoplasmatota archaeon]
MDKYPLNKYYSVDNILLPGERVLAQYTLIYLTDKRIIFSRLFHKYYESFNYSDIGSIYEGIARIVYIEFLFGIAYVLLTLFFMFYLNDFYSITLIFFLASGIYFIAFAIIMKQQKFIIIKYGNRILRLKASDRNNTIQMLNRLRNPVSN